MALRTAIIKFPNGEYFLAGLHEDGDVAYISNAINCNEVPGYRELDPDWTGIFDDCETHGITFDEDNTTEIRAGAFEVVAMEEDRI